MAMVTAAVRAAMMATIRRLRNLRRCQLQTSQRHHRRWVIGGTTYTVTAETEIHSDFGAIDSGTCVKVQLTTDGSAVRELESERELPLRCRRRQWRAESAPRCTVWRYYQLSRRT